MSGMQFHGISELQTYVLQPGDGTLYRFGFVEASKGEGREYESIDTKQRINGNIVQYVYEDSDSAKPVRAWSGLGDGTDFVMVYIGDDEYGSGWCYIRISMLEHLNEHHVKTSLMHQFPQVDKYTVIAVALALQVLVHKHDAIELALLNMLNASELIHDYHEHEKANEIEDEEVTDDKTDE